MLACRLPRARAGRLPSLARAPPLSRVGLPAPRVARSEVPHWGTQGHLWLRKPYALWAGALEQAKDNPANPAT